VWIRDRGLPCSVGIGPACAGAADGRETARRFFGADSDRPLTENLTVRRVMPQEIRECDGADMLRLRVFA
jgi:hypothetical protein